MQVLSKYDIATSQYRNSLKSHRHTDMSMLFILYNTFVFACIREKKRKLSIDEIRSRISVNQVELNDMLVKLCSLNVIAPIEKQGDVIGFYPIGF